MDVQLENGFVKIANSLLDKLAKTQLSGNQWRVLIAILRSTYGWNRKTDRISITQFELKTGLKRRHVVRILADLKNMNLITVEKKPKKQIFYGFQKDFDKWIIPDRYQKRKQSALLPKMVIPITKNGNDIVTKNGAYKRKKETNTKEIVKLTDKETLSAYLFSLKEYQELSSPLKELILTFMNKIRQENKTKRLAASRVRKTLGSFMQIKNQYGSDKLEAGIQAVFRKEQKEGFSYSSNDPSAYVRTVAKSLHTSALQKANQEQAKKQKEALKAVQPGVLFNEIQSLIEEKHG
jgi:phage replication O-like protein O